MKNAIVIALIVLLAVGGGFIIYGAINDAQISTVAITTETKTGEIGDFTALTPTDGVTLSSIPAFSWTEASNAESYTLEIASNDAFSVSDEYYLIKTGIVSTTFNLVADLKKDKTYYWRVTAKNSDHTNTVNGGVLSFIYQATLSDEIPISIGYADEWKVHEVGSKATVTLDHNSFFAIKGNQQEMAEKKDSLRISFDSEDTQRGSKYVESNGWVVVTRSLETEFYGTDAFYFNFYYSGNDATAYFRLIDEDNEYWYAPIKLAVNAKQTIIMRLSDFTLRTKGTPVMNEKFDYHYLKSMELVFERVDGDGVAYFGNLKAIKYDDYKDVIIDSVDFRNYGAFKNDSAYFTFTNTVSEDGKKLTYAFTTNTGVPESQRGYGFVKMNVGKILASSDAFSFNVDLSGVADKNFNFLFRVIEEDNDVWYFKMSAKDIPADGNLLVPFSAFLLSEFKGDGIRQFYVIKQFQFGLNSCYWNGAITVGNFDIVMLSDNVDDLYKRDVDDSGLIEDFESYTTVLDVYYKWQTSTANKDEQIERFTDTTIGLKNHVAKMYYKTDLPEAEYRVNFESVEGYTAIEFLAKDVPHGSYGGVLTVYLYGGPNELYSYKIKKNNFDDEWTRYIIPISAFELTENSFGSQHIVCDSITGISFGFSASTATLLKTKLDYDSGSYACIDNIRFTNASEFSKQEVSGKITMSGSKAMISDFESDDTFVFWDVKDDAPFAANEVAPNAACVIKEDESASGTGRSLQLSYKTQMVAPFSTYFVVDDSVSAKGLTLLLKGDGRAPYIEIVVYVGNKGYKKRIDVADGWNYYSIGFSEFKYNNTAESLSASSVTDVSQIAFYIKNYSGNYIASNLYLDEIYFDNSITVSTNSVVAYSA